MSDEPDADQQGLERFGVDPDPAPHFERKTIIDPPGNQTGIAGFVCHEKERDIVAYTTRRSDYHYYQKGDGYAISRSILVKLKATGANRIYVHEKEPPKDVHEFTLRQYLNGDDVPEEDLDTDEDPQRFVPLDDAKSTWEGHGEHMFTRPFESAIEYVKTRRRGW